MLPASPATAHEETAAVPPSAAGRGPAATPRCLADSKLARGLALLGTFRPGDTTLMLKQLTGRAGLATGTAHRLSRELAELGMLDRVPGGFRPGWAVARLALRATTWPALAAAAGPPAERLLRLTGCPVTLHLATGGGLLPMWQLTCARGFTECRPVPDTGDLSPLLPDLGRRATVDRVAGGRPVLLAAVHDDAGDLVAVLGMNAGSDGRLHRFGPVLAAAAREIGRTLPPSPVAAPPSRAHPAGAGVLARGIGLLGGLLPGERAVRRLDIVERAAIPRSTVYRCLEELLRGGMLAGDGGLLGPGPLARRLAPVAVTPRVPPGDRMRALARAAGGACWLTPVDPDLGVPLNGVVLRPSRPDPGTVRDRWGEWALVSRTVGAAVRGHRAARGPGGPHAVTIALHHGGLPAYLTVVTDAARLPLAERLLHGYDDPPALSA